MKSKKFITTILAALTILGCLILTACPGEVKNEDVFYTVTYETEHGTAPQALRLRAGTVLQAADLPALVADGFVFEGWYINTVKITPELQHKVTADIKLVAKWSVDNSATNQGNDDNQGGDNNQGQDNNGGDNNGTQGDDNNQGTENQGTENQGTENQGTENQGGENQGEGNQGEQNQGGENQGEGQGGENQGEGNQGGENQGEQNQGEQNQGGENQGQGQGGENPPTVYYTILYSTPKGTVPASKTIAAGTALTAEYLQPLTLDNYEFAGWYIGGEKITAESNFIPAGTSTLVAKWYYTISYSTEYGTAPTGKKVLSGTTLTENDLRSLTYDDYDFAGWFIRNRAATVGTEVTDNITLTARWTRSGFSIDVTADTILTDDEKELAVTAELSGGNYILTATPGYDFYIWTVDSTDPKSYSYNCYYYDDVNSTMNSFRWGYNNPTISETLKNNTLTFNENTLPRGVAKYGTYVV